MCSDRVSEANRAVELAKRIHGARRILVVGVDLAASLAWFLAYGLTPLGFDAEAPVGSTGNLQHKIDLLTEKDLMVAISFGRCLRETVEAVERAHARGVPRLASPTAHHTDRLALRRLSCRLDQQSFVYRFLCRADGSAEYDHRRVRSPATEASTRDVKPHRTGIPHRQSLVPGTRTPQPHRNGRTSKNPPEL